MSLSLVRDDAHRVAVLAYEKLCLFEFATVLDLLRDRGSQSPPGWYQLSTVSLEGAFISSDCQVPVQVATDPELLLAADTIGVPGWRMGPVVATIAETMGFNAVDTFRHHFRRLVGTTPSRFRSTRTRL